MIFKIWTNLEFMINNIFITIQKGLDYLHQTLELAKTIPWKVTSVNQKIIKYSAAGKSVNNKWKNKTTDNLILKLVFSCSLTNISMTDLDIFVSPPCLIVICHLNFKENLYVFIQNFSIYFKLGDVRNRRRKNIFK